MQIADNDSYLAKADGTNVSTNIATKPKEFDVYMFFEPTPRPEYAFHTHVGVLLSFMVASNYQYQQARFKSVTASLGQRSYPEQGILRPSYEKQTWHSVTPPYAFMYQALFSVDAADWLERDWNNLVPTLHMVIKKGGAGWTMRIVMTMLAFVVGAKPKPGGRLHERVARSFSV